MRIVIQRVRQARVEVDGEITGQIGTGLLVLLGIAKSDSEKDADYLVEKVLGLRMFPDEAGKMNRSVVEAGFPSRTCRGPGPAPLAGGGSWRGARDGRR